MATSSGAAFPTPADHPASVGGAPLGRRCWRVGCGARSILPAPCLACGATGFAIHRSLDQSAAAEYLRCSALGWESEAPWGQKKGIPGGRTPQGLFVGMGLLHMSCAWVHVSAAWVIARPGMGFLFVDSCTKMPGFLARELRNLAHILILVGAVGIMDCEVRGRGQPLTPPVLPSESESYTVTPGRSCTSGKFVCRIPSLHGYFPASIGPWNTHGGPGNAPPGLCPPRRHRTGLSHSPNTGRPTDGAKKKQ